MDQLLDRIPVYSGYGLDRIPVYSGYGLDRIPVYSGYSLDRIPVYSGYGLDRIHCIIKCIVHTMYNNPMSAMLQSTIVNKYR